MLRYCATMTKSLYARLISCLADLPVDTMFTAVDRAVLTRQNCLNSGRVLDLTSESRHFRDQHDDLVILIRDDAEGVRSAHTLNFCPLDAARMMRSTNACAIRFFTGPSGTVLEMLKWCQTAERER